MWVGHRLFGVMAWLFWVSRHGLEPGQLMRKYLKSLPRRHPLAALGMWFARNLGWNPELVAKSKPSRPGLVVCTAFGCFVQSSSAYLLTPLSSHSLCVTYWLFSDLQRSRAIRLPLK